MRSVNTLYPRIRVCLAQECAAQSPFSGELEADESYFGPKRIRGRRGRGAGGKTIVFGLFKRGDCVYTEIVPNASKATLQAIIRGKVDPNSPIHTNGWRGTGYSLREYSVYERRGALRCPVDKGFRAAFRTASIISPVMPLFWKIATIAAGHSCPTNVNDRGHSIPIYVF